MVNAAPATAKPIKKGRLEANSAVMLSAAPAILLTVEPISSSPRTAAPFYFAETHSTRSNTMLCLAKVE